MNKLEELFLMYNEMHSSEISITYHSTIVKVLKTIDDNEDLYEKVMKYDLPGDYRNTEFGELTSIVQPKSQNLRLLYIDLIINSIPDSFFKTISISKNEIFCIILAIYLYYSALLKRSIDNKKHSRINHFLGIRRTDYYVGYKDLKRVFKKIKEESFLKFIELFSFSIDKDVSEYDNEILFNNKDLIFIPGIAMFGEYMMFAIEKKFLSLANKEEKDLYYADKGKNFEYFVYLMLKNIFNDVRYSMEYNPNKSSIAEIDILINENNHLIVCECKSGTLYFSEKQSDEFIKRQLIGKIKKAYKTLNKFTTYFSNNENFKLYNNSCELKGNSKNYNLHAIHLSMYSFDAIAPSIHQLKLENNEKNPSLSMSFEHFLVLCAYCDANGFNVFDYLDRRKENLKKYPKVDFEINELDLFIELMHKESMLNQFLSTNKIENNSISFIFTFHDENGEEYRPASLMIEKLDQSLMDIFLKYARDFKIKHSFLFEFIEHKN